eukprot:Gb_11903 [translate_table: standard]
METIEKRGWKIVEKLRAFIPWRVVPSNISRDFWMPDRSCRMCYECDSQFTLFNRRHHCRICGRVFCWKCTQNTNVTSANVHEDEDCIRVCNFCFKLREQEIALQYNEAPYLTPQISLSSSSTTFASCASSTNSSIGGSSTSLLCNNRSDEDEDGEFGKDLEDPQRRFITQAQEYFDGDSVIDLDPVYVLNKVQPSNFNSQSDMDQAVEITLRKIDNSKQSRDESNLSYQSDVPAECRLSRSGEESDGTENVDECNDELSMFQRPDAKLEQPNPELEKPFYFENNGLIWIPPEPEDEEDEIESTMLDDDDDDEGGLPCSADSFSSKEYRNKDRPSEEHGKGMKSVVDGHYRALVAQLLMGENVAVGEENGNESWLEIVTSLSWQAAMLVKPDASEGRGMDPGGYVKVKCIACGLRSESEVIKGVVFKKNVAHKHMTRRYKNPRLLLLGGALEYQRTSNQLSSLDTLLQQEMDYLKMAVARIEAHHPNVLLVEKTVSRHAQECLLAKEISLVLDVKKPRLERIARCTGAQIVSSLDNLTAPKVKHCELFHVEKFVEEHGSAGEGGKKLTKTLMFFEGCPKPLGCTVLLKGANGDELKKVKRVVQFAVFAAYHLALETSFLADERATLPKIPLRPQINLSLPDKHERTERSISTIPGFTFPIPCEQDTVELQMQNSASKSIPINCLQSSSSLNCIEAESKPSGSLCHVVCSSSSGATSPAQTESCFNMCSVMDASTANEGMHQKGTYDRFSPPPASSSHLISGLSASLKKVLGEALPLTGTSPYAALTSYFGIKEKESKDSDIADDASIVSVASQAPPDGMASGDIPGELHSQNQGITDNVVELSSFQDQIINEHKNQDSSPFEEHRSSKEGFQPSLADHQSILVSLSSQCVLKGTVCERGHLTRIKYYGSFDKSLGRFLQDKLFNQNSRCSYCEEPPEAHIHCYTHQQGRLIISVKRVPEQFILPGEREGKIWMWHRCLKCTRKNGIPQATRRVVMSDAAWGLSFGKFLELSFSNHAAASRVASCGHSLHRDCLRFYGLGSMVACFRYSSISVHNVHLPPHKLEFNDPNQQEWLRKEAAEVAEKGELFFVEVSDLLKQFGEKIASAGSYPGVNVLPSRQVAELEGMLQKERAEFKEFMQNAITQDWQPGQPVADILDLNRLRLQLIFETYVWDHRLHYLHSSLKVKRSLVNSDTTLSEDLNVSSVKENGTSEKLGWNQEAYNHHGNPDCVKSPVVGNDACAVVRNDLDSSGLLQFEEDKHTIADEFEESPSIPGTLQESCLAGQSTEIAGVDLLVENAGLVLSDQVQINGDPPFRDLSTNRQDAIYDAGGVMNGKCYGDNKLSGNISVGVVGSRDILDVLEEDIVVRRTLSEGHSRIMADLSDTLDAAWTGEGHPVTAQAGHVTSQGQEVHSSDPSFENSRECTELTLKLVSDPVQPTPVPSVVKIGSVDSSSNAQDKGGAELPHGSTPSLPVKSLDSLEDIDSWIWVPFSHLYMVYRKGSFRSLLGFPPRFELLSGYAPAFLSPVSKLLGQGGAILPTGVNDTVIAVYDDEPTSLIAYALASKQYQAQISDKAHEEEKQKEKDGDSERESENLSGVATVISHPLEQSHGSSEVADIPFEGRSNSSEDGSTFEDVSTSGSNVIGPVDPLLYTKVMHVEVSFSDESPLRKGKYSVICYYAKQFDALQKKCCPTEMEFIRSLSRCKKWGAQGGKSKVFFAKTLDDRFIVKQVTKTELESFFDFAPEYFKHLSYSLSTGSPTCLAKILGIYQVTVKHAKSGKDVKMDLMVMENLLFGRTATRLYDLKGSLRYRYNSDSSGANKVLLDQNFMEAMLTSPVFVGNKAKHLLERAVWNDTAFLTSINVMDYSLLVGVDEDRRELVVGIIDFMRQYTWDKHLETWVKASGILGGPKNVTPTVISPKQYKKRFRKAMSTYFLTVPDPWSPSIIPITSQINAGEDGSPFLTEEEAKEQVTKSNV